MRKILVTGSTDGIGLQTALELALLGHEVIIHGRREKYGQELTETLQQKSGNKNLHYINADLSDFESIQRMAETLKTKFEKLDVLINNAGVLQSDKVVLPNGFEKTFMINHLAHFYLTHQIIELVHKSPYGRIVNVSSQAQSSSIDFDNLNGEKYFDMYGAYGLSKLANVLFTYKLHRMLKDYTTTVNALHPGVIATKLLHVGWGSGGAPVETGAKTSVFVATSNELTNKSGLYFVNSQERKSSAISYDQKIQDRLWEISMEFCGLS